MTSKHPPVSQTIQFVASFVLPTVILLTLSDKSKLGPLPAMFLALAPPVAVELYSVLTRRKSSFVSLFAIVGILLIGLISLLGLSEEWLGIRRAGIYVIGSLAIIMMLAFKRDLIDKALESVIDMKSVREAGTKEKTEQQLARHTAKVAYLFAGFLLLIAAWSYILTLIAISAPTGSSEFNAEYAKLRLLSLPYVTLPFVIGTTGLLMYLLYGIEKLTGLEVETLLKRNHGKSK